MFRGFLRPGQGFKPLDVYARVGKTTKTGRPLTGDYEPIGKIVGIISQASQQEVEQWKQNGHPISHTIVQYSPQNRAQATDVLVLTEKHFDQPVMRYFFVQGVQDPGELGHFAVYKVQERADLSG